MAFSGHTFPVAGLTSTSSFIPSRSQCLRRPRAPIESSSSRVPILPAVSMSVTNDLIFKALELGVGTFVGNAVASQRAAKKEESSGFFGLGKKDRPGKKSKESVASKASSVDTGFVDDVFGEVMKLGDQLQSVVDSAGPPDKKKWVKLAVCIIIDLIGSGSLGIPIFGDLLDVVTAPVTTAMLQAIFGNTFITVAGFVEEILPGTDGIPTATLAWLAENSGYLQSSAGKKTKL